jgi:uncharacterized protein (DUF2267 family)
MNRNEFLATDEHHAGIDAEEAARATRATLETLAERITGGEARDIAAQLPAELRPFLEGSEAAEPFDVEEFLRRVAERDGMPVPTAARHVRAVFTALGRAVDRKELADMIAQLPKDFRELLDEVCTRPPRTSSRRDRTSSQATTSSSAPPTGSAPTRHRLARHRRRSRDARPAHLPRRGRRSDRTPPRAPRRPAGARVPAPVHSTGSGGPRSRDPRISGHESWRGARRPDAAMSVSIQRQMTSTT